MQLAGLGRRYSTKTSLILASILFSSACSEGKVNKPASSDLEKFVQSSPIGVDADYWIEMQNLSGEWEKTGLIFGYHGDRVECEKAIDGLQAANDAREYRCKKANIKSD